MNATDEILLVYDKQCPACEFYCNLARIRESAGRLVLVDARDGGPIMDEIKAAGLDIDQGMVLKVGERLDYGSERIGIPNEAPPQTDEVYAGVLQRV